MTFPLFLSVWSEKSPAHLPIIPPVYSAYIGEQTPQPARISQFQNERESTN